MKKLNPSTAITKVFAVALLLLFTQLFLMSQIAPVPISGNIFGEVILGSSFQNGYRYVSTASAIYACKGDAGSNYFKVYSAPVGYTIAASNPVHYYNGDYRAVLLTNGQESYFSVVNKINVPAVDSNDGNLVGLPVIFEPVTKIAGSGKALYTLTHLVGCGISGHLLVSYDHGQSWTQDTVGFSTAEVYDFAIDNSENLYTTTSSGVFKQLANDTFATPILFNQVIATGMFVDRMNRIVLTNFNQAYLSADGGLSFSTDSALLTGNFNAIADDAFGNIYLIAVNWSGVTLFTRIDAAGNANAVNSNLNMASQSGTDLHCFSGDSLLIIGSDNGVFTSSDLGNTWTNTNNNISAENIYSIIQQPFGRLVCATDQGIFYKDEADDNWHLSYAATTAGISLFNDNDGHIFAHQNSGVGFGATYAPLIESIDNGFSWNLVDTGAGSTSNVTFYMDETGAKHFYTTNHWTSNAYYIWTQLKGDSIWSVDTMGFMRFNNFGNGINTVYGDGQGYLYAALATEVSGNYMYRRPVNGTKWVIDTIGLPTSQNVTSMASSPEFGIIAATGGPTLNNISTIYHRTDTGWVVIPARTDSSNISAISVDANGVILAAEINVSFGQQTSAVYYTTNNGNTWSQAFLTGMVIQGSSNFLQNMAVQGGLVAIGNSTYALTAGNWGYVFTSHKTATGIDVQVSNLNNSIIAFPNPSATGEWTIKTSDELMGGQMELTDMNGRIVVRSNMSNTNTTIGSQLLSTGNYILNIRQGQHSASSVLVKQ